ncbi:unnamed protein product [Chrysodeixis includens]|uniref:Kazal-like domain-containing protein n=1 Tax=Chrysodeixis includens TaxID=689277 RepID=A0A9P0FQN4_CHRIL|nr:unnamed protein product [Chrysodeixis includens]
MKCIVNIAFVVLMGTITVQGMPWRQYHWHRMDHHGPPHRFNHKHHHPKFNHTMCHKSRTDSHHRRCITTTSTIPPVVTESSTAIPTTKPASISKPLIPPNYTNRPPEIQTVKIQTEQTATTASSSTKINPVEIVPEKTTSSFTLSATEASPSRFTSRPVRKAPSTPKRTTMALPPITTWRPKTPPAILTEMTPEPETTPSLDEGPPTLSPEIINCLETCPATPEFNPVCGTNFVMYENEGRLFCAKSCGIDVSILRRSLCPPPVFDNPFEEDPPEGEPPGGGPREGGLPGRGRPEGEPPGEGRRERGPPGRGRPEGEPPAEGPRERGPPGRGRPEGEPPGEGPRERGPPGRGRPEGEPPGEGPRERGPLGRGRPEGEPPEREQPEGGSREGGPPGRRPPGTGPPEGDEGGPPRRGATEGGPPGEGPPEGEPPGEGPRERGPPRGGFRERGPPGRGSSEGGPPGSGPPRGGPPEEEPSGSRPREGGQPGRGSAGEGSPKRGPSEGIAPGGGLREGGPAEGRAPGGGLPGRGSLEGEPPGREPPESGGSQESSLPSPPPTLPDFLLHTTPLSRFHMCMRQCPITADFTPVCGTDLVTYMNMERLLCAQKCGDGVQVQVLCEKPCAVCGVNPVTTSKPKATTSVTTSPITTTSRSKKLIADIRFCMRQCPVTPEYNPICGTDRLTYTNPGHLLCAQMCGIEVTVAKFAPCHVTSTSTTTTEFPLTYDELNCIRDCRVTAVYNPVCGTDNLTYINLGHLECARYCGLDVSLKESSRCRGDLDYPTEKTRAPTSTTTTTVNREKDKIITTTQSTFTVTTTSKPTSTNTPVPTSSTSSAYTINWDVLKDIFGTPNSTIPVTTLSSTSTTTTSTTAGPTTEVDEDVDLDARFGKDIKNKDYSTRIIFPED